MAEAQVCRRVRVRGVVQGVGFRWSTVQAASGIGVSGWVRNRVDGSVEIMAWGEHERVMRLLDWARHGPPHARVTQVEVEEAAVPEPPAEAGFRQLSSQ